MKNDFVDTEVMHRSLGCYCMAHGGYDSYTGYLLFPTYTVDEYFCVAFHYQ